MSAAGSATGPRAAGGGQERPSPRGTAGQPASGGRTTAASLDGLAPRVRDVEVARVRLGEDLERLNYEVRAQMGVTLEKLAWKAAVVGASIVAVLGTQKALTAGWNATRHTDPPTNPAHPRTSWGEAVAWTLVTAVGAAVAKVVATRAAAAGWERATGALPPGLEP